MPDFEGLRMDGPPEKAPSTDYGSFPKSVSPPSFPASLERALPSNAASPPSFPASLERGGFSNRASPAMPPTIVERGGFSNLASPSRSPPVRLARPISQQYPGIVPPRYPSSDTHGRNPSANGFYTTHVPPLPHMPQAHFYGAPDIDLNNPSRGRSIDSSKMVTFQGFDTLVDSGTRSSRTIGNVVLVGREGNLDIIAIEKGKIDSIGHLKNLRGAVIGAKILKCNSRNDPFAVLRPLIAVTIHGPVKKDEEGTSTDRRDTSLEMKEEELIHGHFSRPPSANGSDPTIPLFQTTVDVYSLATQELIASLFATPTAPFLRDRIIPGPPPPLGALRVDTSDNYVTVSSGVSGEVVAFSLHIRGDGSRGFRCIGKFWTAVQRLEQRRYSTSSHSTDSDYSETISASDSLGSPILSLSNRWLAVACPRPSSRQSLNGAFLVDHSSKRPPGVDSHTSSSVPALSCVVDSPEGETFLDRVARGVTQEVFRGSRWIADQGLQAWNSYWSKPQSGGSPAAQQQFSQSPPAQPYFPPTHAQDVPSATASDPGVVSIIDLRRLEALQAARSENALKPIATFQPPHGCSFLSFAPNGLSLMTASRKGDVQYVWDLMQITHVRTGSLHTNTSSESIIPPTALRVRQTARYSRLTESSIVDVIWTSPMGDRIAMLTRKGTVHIFNLPLSAFQWPPLRRSIRPTSAPPRQLDGHASDNAVDDDSAPSQTSWTSAMRNLGGRTQPMLAGLRGRTPSIQGTLSGFGGLGINSATGIKGGKAVAAGLSKSVGAAASGVNNLRHVGENRLHIPGGSPSPSCVAWFESKVGSGKIGLLGENTLRLYQVKQAAPIKGSKQRPSVFGGRAIEVKIPDGSDYETGFWALHPPPAIAGTPSLHPLSHAEIEANAPYQPFHTDRRVKLSIYNPDSSSSTTSPYPPSSSTPWVFGQPVAATQLRITSSSTHALDEGDDETNAGLLHPDANTQVENLISLGDREAGGGEHVVITTRRRKRKAALDEMGGMGEDDMDGFFEDDCEVLDFAGDRV